MPEVWLRPNRRVLLLAMVPFLMMGILGLLQMRSDSTTLPKWLGTAVLVGNGVLIVGLIRQVVQPRIAYRDGSVLFYLKSGGPIAVPLEVVEAFFQGESLAHLPGESRHHTKSVNLIARLSQRETDWHRRDVKKALGQWDEGYVTVRGTWCEPIDTEVIHRLNRRLTEVKREAQTQSAGSAS